MSYGEAVVVRRGKSTRERTPWLVAIGGVSNQGETSAGQLFHGHSAIVTSNEWGSVAVASGIRLLSGCVCFWQSYQHSSQNTIAVQLRRKQPKQVKQVKLRRHQLTMQQL